jgi:CheY-like chemotaxis protein
MSNETGLSNPAMGDEAFEILLVEDQVKHQRLYKDAWTAALPVTVVCAATAAEALAKALGPTPPDLVILDLESGGAGGEEVLARIRADHRLRHLPVVILTGLSSTDKQLELLDRGADDFIEKGEPPEIIIARVKAQMRHKLALDRLTRMALDRDLFAAGVLKDIGGIRTVVTSLCGQARGILTDDPVRRREELLTCFKTLSDQATKLGAYASDVIQSVRESRRTPKLEALGIEEPLGWVLDVLAAGGTAKRIDCRTVTPLKPVLADKSFLRLALLNIMQHAQRQAAGPGSAAVEISQQPGELEAAPGVGGRATLRTSIRDHGRTPSPTHLATLFQPYMRGDEEAAAGGSPDAGFGLGLSLVAKGVAMMGGRVGAEKAAAGSGTVIWFELPAAL